MQVDGLLILSFPICAPPSFLSPSSTFLEMGVLLCMPWCPLTHYITQGCAASVSPRAGIICLCHLSWLAPISLKRRHRNLGNIVSLLNSFGTIEWKIISNVFCGLLIIFFYSASLGKLLETSFDTFFCIEHSCNPPSYIIHSILSDSCASTSDPPPQNFTALGHWDIR